MYDSIVKYTCDRKTILIIASLFEFLKLNFTSISFLFILAHTSFLYMYNANIALRFHKYRACLELAGQVGGVNKLLPSSTTPFPV